MQHRTIGSPSELKQPNQQDLDTYADKLREADVRKFTDLPATSSIKVIAKQQADKVKAMKEEKHNYEKTF